MSAAQHLESVRQQQRDISRGRHNAESQAAFESIRTNLKHDQIEVLKEFRNADLTNKGLALRLGKFPHQTSGRITELKAQGLLIPTGLRSEKSAVLRITTKGRKVLSA